MPTTHCTPLGLRAVVVTTTLMLLLISSSAWTANTFMCDDFANVSPLSGDGWAVDSCGEIEGNGAFQINIPVAYTPKAGYFVAGGYIGGSPHDVSSFANKTGILGASIGGMPRVWLSGAIVSERTTIGSLQVQLNKETKSLPAFSAGIEGVIKSDCNRLGFAVATKGFCLAGRPIYVTAGLKANSKNARGIGGVSLPINDYLGFAVEYDGLQGNAALIARPMGLRSPVTLLAGYNGHSGWLAGINVSYNVTMPEHR